MLYVKLKIIKLIKNKNVEIKFNKFSFSMLFIFIYHNIILIFFINAENIEHVIARFKQR